MKKKQYVKSLGKAKSWALTAEISTKYVNLTPSVVTIFRGHIWPIGVSMRWLWVGVSLIYVGK